MANYTYFKVTTTHSKIYKVKVLESTKSIFSSTKIWKIYGASYTALFPSYSFLANCEDYNRIAEAIKLVYPTAKKIEVINR